MGTQKEIKSRISNEERDRGTEMSDLTGTSPCSLATLKSNNLNNDNKISQVSAAIDTHLMHSASETPSSAYSYVSGNPSNSVSSPSRLIADSHIDVSSTINIPHSDTRAFLNSFPVIGQGSEISLQPLSISSPVDIPRSDTRAFLNSFPVIDKNSEINLQPLSRPTKKELVNPIPAPPPKNINTSPNYESLILILMEKDKVAAKEKALSYIKDALREGYTLNSILWSIGALSESQGLPKNFITRQDIIFPKVFNKRMHYKDEKINHTRDHDVAEKIEVKEVKAGLSTNDLGTSLTSNDSSNSTVVTHPEENSKKELLASASRFFPVDPQPTANLVTQVPSPSEKKEYDFFQSLQESIVSKNKKDALLHICNSILFRGGSLTNIMSLIDGLERKHKIMQNFITRKEILAALKIGDVLKAMKGLVYLEIPENSFHPSMVRLLISSPLETGRVELSRLGKQLDNLADFMRKQGITRADVNFFYEQEFISGNPHDQGYYLDVPKEEYKSLLKNFEFLDKFLPKCRENEKASEALPSFSF